MLIPFGNPFTPVGFASHLVAYGAEKSIHHEDQHPEGVTHVNHVGSFMNRIPPNSVLTPGYRIPFIHREIKDVLPHTLDLI